MRKAGVIVLLLLIVGFAAMPAFAQAEAAWCSSRRWGVATGIVIAAGFSLAIAAAGCGLGQGKIGAAACEAIARNPGAAGEIRTAMILSLVFVETLVLFTLAVVFVKVTY